MLQKEFQTDFNMMRTGIRIMLCLAIVIIAYTFFPVRSVVAADLHIMRPIDNERVKGLYKIQWSVFNTGTATVPYEIRVKNAQCADAGIALSGEGFVSVVRNGQYEFYWNTGNLTDGGYCLQLCIQNTQNLNECVNRAFQISNHSNHAPIITSKPSKVDYYTNERFEYRASAYDPDGDYIVYQILNAPDFIYINQDGFMTIGNLMRVGRYDIVFTVIDSFGEAATQSFTLNIMPSPTPVATVTGGVTPKVTPKPGSPAIEILLPNASSAFAGRENAVKWKSSGIDLTKVNKIVLEYAAAGEKEFKTISEYKTGQATEYSWDVAEINNGEYVIRISYVGLDNKALMVKVSDIFVIANREDVGAILTIFSLTPENRTVIEDTKPTISAKYAPSDGAEIIADKIKISLDGKQITDECSVSLSEFRCDRDSDLSTGEHTVKVELSDTNDQQLVQTWTFSIETSNSEIEEPPSGENPIVGFFKKFTGEIKLSSVLTICGGLLLIAGVLWFVSALRKRNQKLSYAQDNAGSSSSGDYGGVNNYANQPMAQSSDSGSIESDQPFDFSVGEYDVNDQETTGPDKLPNWLQNGTPEKAAMPVMNGVVNQNNPLPQQAIPSEENEKMSQVHDAFDLTNSQQDNKNG